MDKEDNRRVQCRKLSQHLGFNFYEFLKKTSSTPLPTQVVNTSADGGSPYL
jgi:hypothetical protein